MPHSETDFARGALIEQAEKTAVAIESTKGQARCEAHPHMEQGIVMTLRCLVAIMRGQKVTESNAGSVRRRIAAMVASWAITSVMSASLIIVAAYCLVGLEWQEILAKLLP